MPPLAAHAAEPGRAHGPLEGIQVLEDQRIGPLVMHAGGGGEGIELARHRELPAFGVHKRGIHGHAPGVQGMAVFGIGHVVRVMGGRPQGALRIARAEGVQDLQAVAARLEHGLCDLQARRHALAHDRAGGRRVNGVAEHVMGGGVAQLDLDGGIDRVNLHERFRGT